MDTRIARIGDVALLFAAIVFGTVLTPSVAFVGLPLAAAGVAGLAYRGHTVAAALAAAAGVAAVGVLQTADVVYAAPALAAVVLTVALLPKRSFQAVAGLLVGVLALANVAADALVARLQGTTLPASIAKQATEVATEMSKAMGSSASADAVSSLKNAAHLIVVAWPSTYFQSAVFVGAVVLVAIVWAARRAGRDLDVPPVSRLDLSPHILWAFVAGLLMLAASYSSIAGAITLGAVGLNLVLCVRTLFFVQGFGVMAGVLDRAGVGLGGRIFALAALAALDALTLVVSFTGLLDFWINFRRLPRDDATAVAPVPEDGRRW
jgi:hypothetical protein